MMTVREPQAYVEEWLRRGIISAEQADRMLATDLGPSTDTGRPARASVVLEAAGYLGGALVVVATILITAQYWDDLSDSARLAMTGGTTVGLVLAGYLVAAQDNPAGERLWTVLWLASTVTAIGFLALAAHQTTGLEGHEPVAVAVGAAGYAWMIWTAHRNAVHQIVAMMALMIATAAAISDQSTSYVLPGLGAWTVAAAWFGLGLAGRLEPRRLVVVVAAAGLIVSSLTTLPEDRGFVLALGTVAGLVGIALSRRDLWLLGVAALGMLQVLPSAAMEWFPDSLAAPFAMLGAGVLLVGAAVWTARRRRRTA